VASAVAIASALIPKTVFIDTLLQPGAVV